MKRKIRCTPELARMLLASIVRPMRWGPEPDPIAQDILRSPSRDDILARIPDGSTYLDSGRSALVLLFPDQRSVTRISGVQKRVPITEMLQPTSRNVHGHWQIEVLPRVTMNATQREVDTLKVTIERRGYTFRDAAIDNVGRTPDGKLVVVDAETVRPVPFSAAPEAKAQAQPQRQKPLARLRLR